MRASRKRSERKGGKYGNHCVVNRSNNRIFMGRLAKDSTTRRKQSGIILDGNFIDSCRHLLYDSDEIPPHPFVFRDGSRYFGKTEGQGKG